MNSKLVWSVITSCTALLGPGNDVSANNVSKNDTRPNILVVITDQHSGTVLNQSGYMEVSTPGINKIAGEGVTFTRSYCTNPVCMPSRKSLLTGMMPSQSEPTNFQSIGTIMNENGYETAYLGKWHVGSTGIDEVSNWHGFEFYQESEVDSTIARWGREYLQQEHNDPFFLVTSFLNPHNICEFARNMTGFYDHEYDDGWVDHQIDTMYCPPLPFNFDIPVNEAEGIATRRNQDYGDEHFSSNPHKGWTESQWRQYRYGYDRFVEKVDARIKEVIDELENQNLLENTIIIYTSDHGDAHASHQLTQKKNFYEESVNIPFIVSWKGKTLPGAVNDSTMVSNGLDLYPTLLKIAGIDIPDYLPGEDLSAHFLMETEADPVTREYVVTELDQKVYKSNNPGFYNGRMVVTEKFKYFLFDQGYNKEQLFDLVNDPGELNPVTYDPAYHDDLLACREMLREWINTHNDDFDMDAAIYSVKYDARRLNNGQPVITQEMFTELDAEDEGENINGPSVIRIPEWIAPEDRAHPDAFYYCYFAHHDGQYIRMAWASEIEGTWHLYQTGSEIEPGDRGVLDLGNDVISLDNGIVIPNNHLASPDVHVDDENQRIIMYFHSGGPLTIDGTEYSTQRTFVSYSPYGLDFYDQIQPVLLGRSYFRVFEHENELYALGNSGDPYQATDINDPWTAPPGFDFTQKLWTEHPDNPFQDDINYIGGFSESELRVRHTSVRKVDDELHVFYSRRGDLLENIQMSKINLSVDDWEDWDATYPPAEILVSAPGWEGGDLTPAPSETSAAPEDVNQLRDPYVFTDKDGSLYLFYAGRGENAIGLAKLQEAHMKVKSLSSMNDASVKDGNQADVNFGSEPLLEVFNGTDTDIRKAFIQFDLTDITEADQVFVRLYTSTQLACPITVHGLSGVEWNEEEITWNNAPAATSSITTTQIETVEKYYEWDISDFAKNNLGENITLVFSDESAGNILVSFSSKEGSNPPEINIINNSTEYAFRPVTPSPLFASAQSPSEINLNWNDNAVNEDGFLLERKEGDEFLEIATLAPNVTSFNETTLQSATDYTYRIRAYNAEGFSNFSNEVTVTTLPDTYITSAFQITEDAYVRGGKYSDDTFGTEDILRVKTGNLENFFRKTYLKFDLNTIDLEGVEIGKGVMRLYANKTDPCAIIASESDDNWSESTITWSNAPISGSQIAKVDIGYENIFYEWDITSYLKTQNEQDGIVSVCLEDMDGANEDVFFNSKEANEYHPELVIIADKAISAIVNTISIKKDMNLSVYPNPASNVLNVKTNQGSFNHLIISDLTGNQVITLSNIDSSKSINIEQLKNGIYILRAVSSFGSVTRKFVIIR